LSDEAWAAIEPHLPKNQQGARRIDDRRVISGIVHVRKVGCRWCAARPSMGRRRRPTIAGRALASGSKLLAALVGVGAVTRSTAIDSTDSKAQRAAFGGKGSAEFRRSVAREAGGRPGFTPSPMSSAVPMR
jgi:transposase